MYNRNDKTFYLSVIIPTGIIIITKRLCSSSSSSSSKPTLECKQIFFKIFYPPDKFEWNTYRLYIFPLNSSKSSFYNLVSRYFAAYYSRLKLRVFAHLSASEAVRWGWQGSYPDFWTIFSPIRTCPLFELNVCAI